MTARTTQPRPSKGPLGERGRRLQERLGTVPLAAITRRGVVPERLRASWSCLAAAAKAAGQPANCRRHEGWSRSPSPRTRQGTRSLIGARFQPDWGKPNVRLIGGREETDASRLARAAHGASRLPDHRCCRFPLGCQRDSPNRDAPPYLNFSQLSASWGAGKFRSENRVRPQRRLRECRGRGRRCGPVAVPGGGCGSGR